MTASRKADVDAAVANVDFEKNTYQVELVTTEGTMRVNLFPEVAPGHCRNIIGLARIGFYDGIVIHRVIKDFVLQVGCPQGTGTGGPGYQIPAEFNDRPHNPGTLSMARTSDPNSAGSQFFICVGRVPHLDGQYTVFGETADDESLAVAMKIGATPTGSGDRPINDITLQSATVTETAK